MSKNDCLYEAICNIKNINYYVDDLNCKFDIDLSITDLFKCSTELFDLFLESNYSTKDRDIIARYVFEDYYNENVDYYFEDLIKELESSNKQS